MVLTYLTAAYIYVLSNHFCKCHDKCRAKPVHGSSHLVRENRHTKPETLQPRPYTHIAVHTELVILHCVTVTLCLVILLLIHFQISSKISCLRLRAITHLHCTST